MYQLQRYTYCTCDECPIAEGFAYRTMRAKESSHPPQYEYCWCPKVDFEFYIGGYCTDALQQITPPKPHKHPPKRDLAYRRSKKQKFDQKRRKIIAKQYNKEFYFEHDLIDGRWTPIETYVKFGKKHSRRERFFKRYSNRLVRRNPVPAKGNGYRRLFDYRWELD